MMSELEKDISDFLYNGQSVIASAGCRNLADYLTSKGYTRPGLTDAQREAVDKAYSWLRLYHIEVASQLSRAFPSTPTPPEPPKPERIVRNADFVAGWRAGLRAANLLNITQENAEWLMPNEAMLPIPGNAA